MIALSIQDQFDGSTKVQDLREAIGQTFSDNYSSTCRSRLVSVTPDGNHCIVEEVKSEYSDKKPQTGQFKRPSWLIWNGMFF
jgi:hypothetical protein